MWVYSIDIGIKQLSYVDCVLNKVLIFIYHSNICVDIGDLSGVILMSFTCNTKNTKKHNAMRIPTLSIPFIIHTDYGFFLFSKFLPMKERQWTSLSTVEYKYQTQLYG